MRELKLLSTRDDRAHDDDLTADPLRLQVLGPLQLWRGGTELDAGPPQQAHLLSVLLAQTGRPTSAETLIEIIWGGASPQSALNSLHKYVGALRHLLEPDIPPRHSGSYIQRRGNGYVWTSNDATLDLNKFRSLLTATRLALVEQHSGKALDLYVEGLNLWRGPVGIGLDGAAASASMFASLNAEFTDTVIAATALAIRLDAPDRVIPHLHMAAAIAPLHEPVQASYITALGAAEQRAEALAVFQTVRTRLVEELGIDPGHALVAAHRQVLDPQPTNGTAGRSSSDRLPSTPEDRPVAAEPSRVASFSGRDAELAAIRSFATAGIEKQQTPTALLITGPPGVGKTTTTLEALHGISGWESRLFANLHGFDPSPLSPLQVLRALLAQVNRGEEPPGSLDESIDAWRAAVETPLLVVLDNASAEAQVRPVLAVDGPIMVIITSRRALPGLEVTERIELGPLARKESTELLARLIPEARRPDADLSLLAELCGDLPLALRIAGARMASRPEWSVSDFILRLADERNRLQQLVAGDVAVNTAFSLSYDALPPHGRRLFRSLSLLYGRTFSAAMAASIDNLDPDVCRDHLDTLTDLGLLQSVSGDRYRLHDLLRVYAADRFRDEASAVESRDQRARLNRWTLTSAARAARLFPPAHTSVPVASSASREELQQAKDWLVTESDHWFGAFKNSAERGEHELVVDTAMALTHISADWWQWPEWFELHSIGAASALHLNDMESHVIQLHAASAAAADDIGPSDSEHAARRALAAAEAWGDPYWIACCRYSLADSYYFVAGDIEAAQREAKQAAAQYEELSDFTGQVASQALIVGSLTRTDITAGVTVAERTLALIDGLGPHPERHAQPNTLNNFFNATARIFIEVQRFDEALAVATRTMMLPDNILDLGGNHIRGLRHRGFALLGLERYEEAREAFETALTQAGSYMPDWWVAEIQEGLDSIPNP
ncbi:BTAD domain-containing putative transcriptional regulator [Microbacterium sp. cx-59]|uniref:AfsR/SARP family transcriptional regulator n=1 Tax=Microbacterium sp. cx-59 TaxID=2891207 RepID=UPI001E5B04E6|nr:BTAD domain-containing putative transcriptional regulator [Microbacterium sp. cx-59]MCC4908614.1 winged helix-turn-helix domain-containing protein [Microbacterium sp. cx-59]